MRQYLTAALLFLGLAAAQAQTTTFTYQGQLLVSGSPHTGSAELRFTVWDAASGGLQLAATTPTDTAVNVTNGLFAANLDFGAAVFTGADRWLDIQVRTGLGAFTPLTTRQKLTAAPYAIHAREAAGVPTGSITGAMIANGAVGTSGLADGAVTQAKLLDNSVSSAKITDGSVQATDVNVASFDTTFWRMAGNTGTTPGTHFLGTADNQPFELRVNNQRAVRLEPGAETPNLIGGSISNAISPGIQGATIGGGGRLTLPNLIGSDFAVISGGHANSIAADSARATISGGYFNLIETNAPSATVSGGRNNTVYAGGQYAFIAGGLLNTVSNSATYAVIGGGLANLVDTNSHAATIGGGSYNIVGSNTTWTTIAGGGYNFASGFGATVGGGSENAARVTRATVAGGRGNQALGDSSVIGGGSDNATGNLLAGIASGGGNTNNGVGAFIGGGRANTITFGGEFGTIPGGRSNTVGQAYGLAAGRRAQANHPGSFVWADSTDADFASTATDQFSVRAAGGARFETGGGGMTLDGLPVLAGPVYGSNLADDSVSSLKIVDGTVGTGDLANGAVTTAKLASDSVTSAAIVNGSVQASDLSATGFDTTFWRAGGNAGTTAGTHFLGTTDNQPLELRVNSKRVLRIEPFFDGSAGTTLRSNIVNMIAGSSGNIVNSGVRGATISGGGASFEDFVPSINRVTDHYGTIGGGNNNVAGNTATVGGGSRNSSTGYYATVGGGRFNTSSGGYATIPGGDNNSATNDHTFAAGYRAVAGHRGAFVWADSTAADFPSTLNDQFRVRASGGMEVVGGTATETFKFSGTRTGDIFSPLALGENRNTSGNSAPALRLVNHGGNSVNGVLSVSTLGVGNLATFGNASTFVSTLTTNGTWSALAFNPSSDRNAKENFTAVNPRDVLDKVASLPLARWNYKAAPGLDHIGPVAQDFHAAFGLNGDDDKHIATVDADGVALAAIQGLNQRVTEELKQKATEITELRREVAELKRLLSKLSDKGN